MTEQSAWTFKIFERSVGVYEGRADHLTGASIVLVGTDPDELLERLRRVAADLVTE